MARITSKSFTGGSRIDMSIKARKVGQAAKIQCEKCQSWHEANTEHTCNVEANNSVPANWYK